EFLRIMRNGDENADDIAGRFTGTYTGADARSCKYGTTCEITDKKGKGLPESGKGEALEIPHSPEKEPVSCLTDWHYTWLVTVFPWRFNTSTSPVRLAV
ncbi:transposase insG for insertion sequence element IS4, partial [Escherichia coli KTE69]